MKKFFYGNDIDRMSNLGFRFMACMFFIFDKFKSPDKKLDPFSIQKGQTVIDYGCGTGRYLKQASGLVGETGKVYAVDIHELAVAAAFKMIKKYGLKNVYPIRTDGKSVNIQDHVADIIYALDMFHMVADPNEFLKELHRIAKPDGTLYLEDGHQPRELAKKKVLDSGHWRIIEETSRHMRCKPG
jgi:ubiquinone/menaquinone biosynthesis C-methylase UbiE